MEFDATLAGNMSNSYATVEEADAYFYAHWSMAKADVWDGLTEPQKEAVLMSACSLLNTLRVVDRTVFRYQFQQMLPFPRNVDIYPGTGTLYIPQEVKDAQCEQAVYMVSMDESVLAAQNMGIFSEAIAVGPVRVSTAYGSSTGSVGGSGHLIGPMVLELMRPFLRNSNRLNRA